MTLLHYVQCCLSEADGPGNTLTHTHTHTYTQRERETGRRREGERERDISKTAGFAANLFLTK